MLVLLLCLITSVSALEPYDSGNISVVVNITVYGVLNESVTLPCTPSPENSGEGHLTLAIWRFPPSIMVPATPGLEADSRERIHAGHNGSLVIRNLKNEDADVYECVAYDKSRVLYKYSINLVVRGPPGIPHNVTLVPLSDSTIHVSWSPGLDYNSPVDFHHVVLYTKHNDPGNRRKNVTFPLTRTTFVGLQPYTTYHAIVRAHNAVGRSEFTVPVSGSTQPGKPNLPPQIYDVTADRRSVEVRVFCSSKNTQELRGQFLGYGITVYKGGQAVVTKFYNTTDHTEKHILVGQLEPYTGYKVSVSVFNGRHYGPKAWAHFTTLEDKPEPPNIYQITNEDYDKFTASWTESSTKNGVILGYKLWLNFRDQKKSETNKPQTPEVAANVYNHVFTHLEAYTWYRLRIAAKTKAGYGNYSEFSSGVLTDVGPPPPARVVNIAVNGTEGILVNWTRPVVKEDIKDKMTYQVCWSVDSKGKKNCLRTQTDDRTQKAYCFCNKSDHFLWTTVPWSALSDLKTAKVTLGVRASMNSIYHRDKSPIEREKEGALSNLLSVTLTEDQMKLLRKSSSSPFLDLDQTTIAGIIVGIFLIFLVVSIAIFFLWRTTCLYRGYEVAEQQVEVGESPPSPPAPTMLSFAQSPYAPIPIASLSDHVFSYHADDDAGYQTEFESIERSVRTDWPTTVARLPDNMPKNRYSNVFAYDHTRVPLLNLHGRKSDYVNASFVDGYHKPHAYIAAQGPLPSTFDDFWQMVWEQNCNVIVMISNFVERGRRKCDIYWPTEGSHAYGVVTVKMLKQTQLGYFTIRVFSIGNGKCKKSSKDRIVYHYQYTDWRDFDVPRSALPVLVFVRCTVRHVLETSGPIVVHCSAGVGRTGTYICIESLIRQMEREHQVNIRGFLEHIRQQRMKLVQTEQQYAFIHDALREYLLCPEHVVGREHLPVYMRCLKEEEPCGCTLMQKQFQLCVEREPPQYEFLESKKACNLPKTRSIYPIDSRRVNLPGEPGVEGSNYINASHLTGYWNRFEFIVTQHPLDTTIADFWKMVWDENSSLIILLSTEAEEMIQFWPCDGLEVKEIGWLRVGYCGREDTGLATRYEFLLSSSREDYALVCHLWQLHNWPATPADPAAAELIRAARHLSEMKKSTGPTIVIDDFGGHRGGIFCALNVLINQLAHEDVLDVYFIFKMYHLQRPQIFHNHAQLEYIYDMMEKYVHESGDTPHSPLINGSVVPERPVSPNPTALENGSIVDAALHVITNTGLQNGTLTPSPSENGDLIT